MVYINHVISGMTERIRLDCRASQVCLFMSPSVNRIKRESIFVQKMTQLRLGNTSHKKKRLVLTITKITEKAVQHGVPNDPREKVSNTGSQTFPWHRQSVKYESTQ